MLRVIPILIVFICMIQINTALAQDNIDREVNQLENRVNRIERDLSGYRFNLIEREMSGYASSMYILFFTGVFCALWAQNTRRNAWLWFFLGFFFSAITLIALLIRNHNDKADQTYHDQ